MATIVFGSGFDLARPPWWGSTVEMAVGAGQMFVEDSTKQQQISGQFTANASLVVSGTVSTIDLAPVGGADWYRITAAAFDAGKIQKLILDGTAASFYAYVFGGNDAVTTTGSRGWGQGGNDTLYGGHSQAWVADGGTGTDWYDLRVGFAAQLNLTTGKVSGTNLPGVTLVSIENLRGGTGADTLVGNSAVNTLDGGSGFDQVNSGVSTAAFVVDLAAGTASNGGNVDRLISIEAAVGTALADRLTGNTLANLLDGRGGADTLTGGAGNDTFGVDQTGDRIVEAAGAGTDTVRSTISLTLGTNLERLELVLGSAAVNGTGNAAANTLVGNERSNTLSGGAGNDTLLGGSGNDRLVGGSENDRLEGGAGNDTFDGGTGVDTLIGGDGVDTYYVDSANDVVSNTSSSADDSVIASASYRLGTTGSVHLLRLTGTALTGWGDNGANRIEGTAAANRLDGGLGNDTLVGFAGNDLYVVDNASDVVVEAADGGTDTVTIATSSLSANFQLAANVEHATVTATGSIAVTGNALANRITGGSGINDLDGGAGDDTLIGGAGDDRYTVDAGDQVIESAGGGNDTVAARADHALAAEIENLVFEGTLGASGTGNELANRLTANAYGCRLDGGAGADTLVGGAGADTFVVGGDGDTLLDTAGGIDTVIASVTWTLQSGLEHLSLDGTADLNGSGNTLANSIVGNAGANQLDGGAGADTLDGGAGADTLAGGEGSDVYLVDAADSIVETGTGFGDSDQVRAADHWTLAAGLEQLVLLGSADIDGTGNAQANWMVGNAGANRLDGAGGADMLYGGAGNDSYVVDDAGDRVNEDAGAGIDSVFSAVSFGSSNGNANVEIIVLTGTANLAATGTAIDNTISGNAGNNNLWGGDGRDTVSFANASGAVNVNLFAGTASGFGSDTLTGFEDVIGSAFNDTLRGSGPANTLTGGDGADRFVLAAATADTVADFTSGVDTIAVLQSMLAMGNGDTVVDGATLITAPGGFAADAELVLAATPVSALLDTAAVAAAFGSAASAYTAGRVALFVVGDGASSALYRFTAQAADADVSASELLLLAVLDNAPLPVAGDFVWTT